MLDIIVEFQYSVISNFCKMFYLRALVKVGTQMLLIRTKLTFIRIDHSAVFIVRQYSFSGCYSNHLYK